jgi:imidazolonepropionase-like amidohydrolase
MSRWKVSAAVAAVWVLAATPGAVAKPEAGMTVIAGATVFDGTGAAPRVADVIVRDGRIAQVGSKLRRPRGARVIDARGLALTPGFYDVHTHWTPAGAPATTPQIATAYVTAGVTTVADYHQSPESWAPRRDWLATLAAPHVAMTARISTPGGHGADWADTNTTRWITTPESARAAIREVIPYKPDLIKAFTDGWRYGVSPDNTSMNEDALAALADEAHKNGLRVTTHTVTVDRGEVAARAKVDIIGHSLQDRDLDDEAVAIIKQSGLSYAATLAVYEPVKPGQKPPADVNSPRVLQSFRKFEFALRNVKRLHDAGVPIALGTDAGMPGTPHGASTLHEMELLVKAGLTPAQALVAGTANSARALGVIADRGTIEPGKRADLVLIDGAPWRDIADVRKTVRVFIDGKQVVGPGIPLPAANAETALAPVPAKALVDDFERPDGRTSLDTLRTDGMDGGMDRTVQVSQVFDRPEGGHALSLAAKMSVKDQPNASVILPLTRGSVRPVDVRTFKGVKFDARGDGGTYQVSLNTLNGRWRAEVVAGPGWRTIEVPFASFQRTAGRGGSDAAWSGADLVEVEVGGVRPAAAKLWLELDNVIFY